MLLMHGWMGWDVIGPILGPSFPYLRKTSEVEP